MLVSRAKACELFAPAGSSTTILSGACVVTVGTPSICTDDTRFSITCSAFFRVAARSAGDACPGSPGCGSIWNTTLGPVRRRSALPRGTTGEAEAGERSPQPTPQSLSAFSALSLSRFRDQSPVLECLPRRADLLDRLDVPLPELLDRRPPDCLEEALQPLRRDMGLAELDSVLEVNAATSGCFPSASDRSRWPRGCRTPSRRASRAHPRAYRLSL